MAYVNRGGVRLWYDVQGSGRPLVLLHGFTLDSRMWSEPAGKTNALDLLSREFQVILIDTRGHGRSDSPLSGYDRATRVADLVAILDHLELDTVDIVGFSQGGVTALGCALEHPERLRSLALVASGAAGWNLGKKFEMLDSIAHSQGIESAKLQWIEWSISYPKSKGRDDIADILERLIGEHSGAYWSDPQRGKYPKLIPDLERVQNIHLPTLIQIGSDDRIFVPLAESLHQKISGSRYSLFAGCGHMLTMEAPERWVSELSDFLIAHPVEGQFTKKVSA